MQGFWVIKTIKNQTFSEVLLYLLVFKNYIKHRTRTFLKKTFLVCGILSVKVAGLRMHNPAVYPAFPAPSEAGSRFLNRDGSIGNDGLKPV
jgi:hypothetical protein